MCPSDDQARLARALAGRDVEITPRECWELLGRRSTTHHDFMLLTRVLLELLTDDVPI